MSKQIDVHLRDGESVRTTGNLVEVVNDETGQVITYIERQADVEVRLDGVLIPRPGEVETR
jgi:hypothetical protein